MRLLLILLPLVITACGSAPERHLLLTGSSTVAPLAAEIAKRYEQLHPEVQIDVQTGGSARGLADVRRGLSDIGMMSRSLKENEADVQAHTLAVDGICVIVHIDNPIDHLESDQVQAIFRGTIQDWSELGGRTGPITVVNKAAGRSTLELFCAYYDLDEAEIHADVIIGDNEQGLLTVAGDPGSIGYVSIGCAQVNADAGSPIRLLPCAGVVPTLEQMRAGHYPIARPLNLITQGAGSALGRDFIRYAQSPAVHDLMERLYVVPLSQ